MLSTNAFIVIALASVLGSVGLMAWIIDSGAADKYKSLLKYGLFSMFAAILGLFFLIDDDSEFDYSGYNKQQSQGGPQDETRYAKMGGGEDGAGKTTVIMQGGADGVGENLQDDKEFIAVDGAGGGVRVETDCSVCPAMVVIKPGTAQLGSLSPLKSGPFATAQAARIAVSHTYAISTNEVTVAQFEAFTNATGYQPASRCRVGRSVVQGASFKSPGFVQEMNSPAVCVTWRDVQHYVDWLSKQAGRTYRLPTEVEWEYAARGGAETAYIWGDEASGGSANYRAAGAKPPQGTRAVGGSSANANSMYDVHGNAWEMTGDCWSPGYSAAVGNGSQVVCSKRIVKGGGWFSGADQLNLAMRAAIGPDVASNGIGFRVVRIGKAKPKVATHRDLRGHSKGEVKRVLEQVAPGVAVDGYTTEDKRSPGAVEGREASRSRGETVVGSGQSVESPRASGGGGGVGFGGGGAGLDRQFDAVRSRL